MLAAYLYTYIFFLYLAGTERDKVDSTLLTQQKPVVDLVWIIGCSNFLHMYMLWFNFILGLTFISFCLGIVCKLLFGHWGFCFFQIYLTSSELTGDQLL